MRNISVVINKTWEAEPALNAMISATISGANLPFPTWLNSPKPAKNLTASPRAVYQLDGPTPLQVTVWCVQDLMNPAKSSSSSEEKYRVLPPVLATDKPDLVFAVGTACYPDASVSRNGKVVVGSQFFLHNGHPGNADSNFNTPEFDKLLTSNVKGALFDLLTPAWSDGSIANFLPVPNEPASPEIMVNQNFVSIGTLNVTNYQEYPTADPASLKAFEDLNSGFMAASLETTHGIIRLSSQAPTLFISGIVNRLGLLNQEATAAQDYIGGFNAGIVIAELIHVLLQSNNGGIW